MPKFTKELIPRGSFKHNPARLNVLSSGGGTQSNAIICMIHAGTLPKPDIIVMSDTEREASNVFEFQRKHIANLCEDIGVEYHIIPKSNYATYDIVGPNPDAPLPGYFTEYNGRDVNGNCGGKQPAFCSEKWKKEVIHRFLNERYGEQYLTQRGVDMWLGISIEEAARRMKITTGKWVRRYPLIELMLTKQMAIQLVEDYGLPTPPASLCWMCPNRDDDLWLYMKEHVPEDFAKACAHEKEIQKEWPHLWLTKYGVPLAEAPLTASGGKGAQLDLVQFCDSGMCMT
ncbi:hypothetical protein [Yersinia enterocolitica]|uniref:hypothetical protein n=1 Tax=Yersinia enterocolitica TaxID=630 RepID=UPI0005E6B83C|nr:hypothetical protein [Yersinia enterocolitica]CQJ66201.1 Uncharacterised protein [Yersinia enterocolitica]